MIEWVHPGLMRRWRQQPPEDNGEDAAVSALYPQPRAIQGQPQQPPPERGRTAVSSEFGDLMPGRLRGMA